MTTAGSFPSVFCAHGSPMNVIADNDFKRSLQGLAPSLRDGNNSDPKTILVVSAHWLTNGTYFTANLMPPTIYDFYGFPPALYEIKYPSMGAPEVAARAADLLSEVGARADNERGIDHAAWTILHHIYPGANIPVIEMSIDIEKPASYHYELGKLLRPLRDEGVLIIGSGNIVHNLGLADFYDQEALPFDWAVEFDEIVKSKIVTNDHSALVDHRDLEASELAVPTNDHYLPMIYILGTQHDDEKADLFFEGMQNASVSMRSFLYR